MRKYYYFTAIIILAVVLVLAFLNKVPAINEYVTIDDAATIKPDYTDTVIPPNIAPLNFTIKYAASRYYVKIYAEKGDSIEVVSRSKNIIIPCRPWKKLLSANRGGELHFDIYALDKNKKWLRFKTITNKIAAEELDSYLAYRRILPVHSGWREMGIYQRNIENYNESLIVNNRYHQETCLNCHTFCNNSSDKMLLGVRSMKYGSSEILVDKTSAKKIGTKFTYTSWHPSGKMAVYSLNKVRQFFNAGQREVRGVFDFDSTLAYYSADSKRIKTNANLSDKKHLETLPTWAPDGKYLYFSSANHTFENQVDIPPKDYDKVRYDLVRISYDIDTDIWGQLETVLSSEETEKSMLCPRISPDGRWLIFCMCDHGSFPIYEQDSDLYIIDLAAAQNTGKYQYRRLDINSDTSESWHSFSSNSRWLAFSSKRDYGTFTRTYFSYIDENGNVYKPLVLPQKDPQYYDRCLETFSVPELITSAVKVTGEEIARVIRSSAKIPVDMPTTMASPKAGGTPDMGQYRE